jgi:hypothetical protein
MLRHVFKLRRASPSNPIEAGKLYSAVANKIAFNNMVRATKEGFSWNMDALKTHLDLNSLKNSNEQATTKQFIQHSALKPPPFPRGFLPTSSRHKGADQNGGHSTA